MIGGSFQMQKITFFIQGYSIFLHINDLSKTVKNTGLVQFLVIRIFKINPD